MHVITFSENRRLLDDCYNAGPQSMAASLRVLGRRAAGKKAAVIGDMAELGELTGAQRTGKSEHSPKELSIDTVIATVHGQNTLQKGTHLRSGSGAWTRR